MEPGMAKTSRPCSSARRAVISEPLSARRLDHQRSEAQAADQPIAARKASCAGGGAARKLADQRALRGDARRQQRRAARG